MVESTALNSAKEYAKTIRESYKNSKIYLFGSYVKGNNHMDSDIDVAIVLDDYKDKMDIMIDLMRLRRKIDSRIEPHPFRFSDFNSNNILAYEVIKYGMEI